MDSNYKSVNSYRQFKARDFYAERLFRAWYRKKYRISVTEYLIRWGACACVSWTGRRRSWT